MSTGCLISPTQQIVFTLGGFLTPIAVNAIQPSINNLDEVVWTQTVGSDEVIFSSLRGQIAIGHLPDISNDGTIAFSSDRIAGGPNGVYLFAVPLRSSVVSQLTLCVLLVGFFFWRKRCERRQKISLPPA